MFNTKYDSQTVIRVVFVVCLLVAGGWIGVAYATSSTPNTLSQYEQQADIPRSERPQVVPERENITVVTGQKSPTSDSKALYAFAANGSLYHYDGRRGIGDVDPSPVGKHTVLYPPQSRHTGSACDAAQKCSVQYIERLNLTTGTTTRLYSFNTPKHRATNWHDVDRVNKHEYVVASIAHDHIRIINVTSGTIEWAWHAQSEYNISGGGPWPADWTHVNDVDKLADGRYMVSLRNQDQVVFIHPDTGLQENWTLGCDDCHSILHEQHNPDYIPASEGGPAVLVADSENNRIVEYQRTDDGEWRRSWVWQDDRIDWPRDADRLPNGNTLIADSHENRVIEVNQQGEIVWEITTPNVYNVERLGTGDGSTGGPSAVRADLENRTAPGRPVYLNGSASTVSYSTAAILWNKVQFVLPDWMDAIGLLFALEGAGVIMVWAGVEASWRGWTVRLPITRRRRSSDAADTTVTEDVDAGD